MTPETENSLGAKAFELMKPSAIVVNTGDDFEHHGLTVCPDIDTVAYTLAGLNNPRTGSNDDHAWFVKTDAIPPAGTPVEFTIKLQPPDHSKK